MREKNKDSYGKNIIQVEGHDLCNNFNYGTCKWKDCKFSHACLKCKGKGHGLKTCEKTNLSKQNQNKTSGVQKAADRWFTEKDNASASQSKVDNLAE